MRHQPVWTSGSLLAAINASGWGPGDPEPPANKQLWDISGQRSIIVSNSQQKQAASISRADDASFVTANDAMVSTSGSLLAAVNASGWDT